MKGEFAQNLLCEPKFRNFGGIFLTLGSRVLFFLFFGQKRILLVSMQGSLFAGIYRFNLDRSFCDVFS